MLSKFVLNILPIILAVFFIFSGCKNDAINDSEPPTLERPVDFRLTDFEPAWSPNGRTIAYVHGDTIAGQTGIWLIDTNGTNKRMLYASVGAFTPTWSPDGQWIAFSDYGQIYKISINGDRLIQLTFDGANYFPSWSKRISQLTFDSNVDNESGGYSVWIMDANGKNREKIADGRMPNYAPTGNQIVFIGNHREIYSVDLNDTSRVTKLTSLNQTNIYATDNRYPKYSPDGRLIAFTSQPSGLAEKLQIWLMNFDGTSIKQLSPIRGYFCDWSPSGEWIVYTDSRTISGRLCIMRSDGKDNHQITF